MRSQFHLLELADILRKFITRTPCFFDMLNYLTTNPHSWEFLCVNQTEYNMVLDFDYQQKVAIYKVAEMMVNADGQVLLDEELALENGLTKLGLTAATDILSFKKDASQLDYNSCLQILSDLEPAQKKFVTSYLGTIISSDGDIDDRELELWRELSIQCGFPIMSNRQAIEIFKDY